MASGKLEILLSITAIWAALIVMGCQKKSPPAVDRQDGGHPPEVEGTTHGGGGDGIDLKAFEAYIRLPTRDLKAYKDYVRPRIAKILGDSSESLSSVESLLNSKTWIIAPVTLKPVSAVSLGTIFLGNDGYQQLGLQLKNEIWLDQGRFDKMTTESQGQLILHEIVMLIYFLKFEPYSKTCARFYNGMGQTPPAGACDKQADAYLPIEPLRPLNDDDYQHIRRVTGLLEDRGATSSHAEIKEIFRANGFQDIMFFSDVLQSRPHESLKLKISELRDLIRAAILTKSLLPNCSRPRLGRIEPCSLEMLVTPAEPLSGLKLQEDTFKFHTGSLTGSTDAYVEEKAEFQAPEVHDHISNRDFFVTVLPQFNIPKQLGSRFYNMDIYLERTRTGVKVSAISFKPYIVTVADEKCTAKILSPNGNDDSVIFADSEAARNAAKLFTDFSSDYSCD